MRTLSVFFLAVFLLLALPGAQAPSARAAKDRLRAKDTDRDGIPDHKDKCPRHAEDKDGFQDRDGCPDPDNDQDRICDNNRQIQRTLRKYRGLCKGRDKCPNRPETYNGHLDKDGCPDRARVKIKVHKSPRIVTAIHFRWTKSNLRRLHYPLLNMVVFVMRKTRKLRRVEVAGHADDGGSEKYNLALSLKRAQVVRRYLIRKGISPRRLVAKGYGRSRKKDKRSTKLARARNRRVEFNILQKSKTKRSPKRTMKRSKKRGKTKGRNK